MKKNFANQILIPLVLVNGSGAGTALLYLWLALPSVFGLPEPAWEQLMVHVALGLGLTLPAAVLFPANHKEFQVLFHVASGRQSIREFEAPAVHRLRAAAARFPAKVTAICAFFWVLAGVSFGILVPLITAALYDLPPPSPAVCLKKSLGIILAGGGPACLVLFFALENSWQHYLPEFFPNGDDLPQGLARISIRKRFLTAILGLTLVPLPLVCITLLSVFKAVSAPRSQALSGLFWELLFISGEAMAVACILSYLLPQGIARPLVRIRRAVREVEKNNLDTRATVCSCDELGHLAQGVNRMITSLVKNQQARECFDRYVSREIQDEILAGNLSGDGEMKRVTLLFSDLRDFTGMVEKNHPRRVVRILNRYFSGMTQCITACGGLVLQFVGDEIEAVFGLPDTCDDHPEMAVQAALAMRERLEQLNRGFRDQGLPVLSHGIGIHSGAVLAGNIGSPDRLSYALVGDTVNTASRLQGLAKDCNTDIIISQTSHDLLTGSYPVRQLPPVIVRGKENRLIPYEILPDRFPPEFRNPLI